MQPRALVARILLTLSGPHAGVLACGLLIAAQSPAAQTTSAIHSLVRGTVRALDSATTAVERARIMQSATTATSTPVTSLLRATHDRLTFRLAEAERTYTRLSDDSVASPVVAAHAALGLAALLAQSARYDDAIVSFERAEQRFTRLRDSSGLAETLTGMASAVWRSRGVAEGLRLTARARALAPAGDRDLRANIGCTDVSVRARAGVTISSDEWRAYLAAAGDGGPRVVAQCLLSRAVWWDNRGQSDSALALLDTLARVQQRARTLNGLASTRQWQGWQYITRGWYAEARLALNEAVALGAQTGTLSPEGWANVNLAALSQRVGEWGMASQYVERGMTALQRSGDQTGIGNARVTKAEGALRQGDITAARREYEALVKDYDAVNPPIKVRALAALAEVARREHRYDDAGRLIDEALRAASQRNMPGWSADLGFQRALLLMAQAQPVRALVELQRILTGPEPLRDASLFEVRVRMAEAHAMAGHIDDAARVLREAMQQLDTWRATLSQRELLLTALGDRELEWDADLGFASIVSSFAEAGRIPLAVEVADWHRAQVMQRQSLQRSALDAARDAVEPSRVRRASAAQTRPATGVAVISYMTGMGNEPTTIFVHTSHGIDAVRSVPLDSLAEAVLRFGAFVSQGSIPDGVSRRLGAALLEPALRLVPADTRRIVLVPDGALHRVPFAALTLSDGRAFGARYAIAIAPSVAIAINGLREPLGTARHADMPTSVATRETSAGRVVAFGAPDSLPSNTDGLAPWTELPGARDEVRRVAQRAANSTSVDGRRATRASFVAATHDGGAVLHVATHARSSDVSITQSALVLRPERGDDGLLHANELAAMRIPFDLVVLSACETAVGPMVAGEGMQGLASAILEAGARAVLATRWRIDDAAIAPFIGDFYAGLMAGHDAVTSLSEARTHAITSGVSPAVWAGFDLLGDAYVAPSVAPSATSATATVVWVMVGLALGFVSWLAMRRGRAKSH